MTTSIFALIQSNLMCSVKGKEIMENMKTLITFYELRREALETGEKKKTKKSEDK